MQKIKYHIYIYKMNAEPSWTAIILQQWLILHDLGGGPGHFGHFI